MLAIVEVSTAHFSGRAFVSKPPKRLSLSLSDLFLRTNQLAAKYVSDTPCFAEIRRFGERGQD